MAIRVPKLLTDLTAARAQRAVALAALGIYRGSDTPTLITAEEWEETGTGFWLWIQTPAANVVSVAPPVVSLSLGAGAPTVSFPVWRVDVNPPTGALALSAEVPTVSVIAPDVVEVLPPSFALSLASAAPTVSIVEAAVVSVEPPTAALAITADAPTVAAVQFIVAVAPPTAALVVTAAAPTVNIESGVPTYSDNFNRANGALGASWTTVGGGMTAPVISSNAVVDGGSAASAAVWTANAVAADQFSEIKVAGSGYGGGVVVRGSTSAKTCYALTTFDDGETQSLVLIKKVAGAHTTLRTGAVSGPHYRLEASGTTITAKQRANTGAAWTTVWTVTDSSIATGSPGLWVEQPAGNGPVDDWTGGAL